jgi:uncharacterized protein
MRQRFRLPRFAWVALAIVLVGADDRRSPALVDAARAADWEQVQSQLEAGADVNATQGDGSTALHWASYWDAVEIADLLIEAGAEVNVANDLGATPLWPASLNGSAAMVQRLLEAEANPNLALLSGETPLMTGSRSGNPEVVSLLLEAGADPNVTATRGQTALMWAVAQQQAPVVKVLIENGADIHARSDVWKQLWQTDSGEVVHPTLHTWIDHGGNTPLLFATIVGDLETAKLLVEAGAEVNDVAAGGYTAIVYAAHSGNTDLLRFLLENGADPDVDTAGYTALHAAMLRGYQDAAEVLLDYGADPNAPLQTTTPTRRASNDYFFHPAYVGATPFWLAARFGQPRVMQVLLEHGADPHFVHDVDYWRSSAIFTGFNRDEQGATTALMAAVGMGGGSGFADVPRDQREALALEAARLAVEAGVDVNAENAEGRTAIQAAQGSRFQTVVDYLLEHGAVLPEGTEEASEPRRSYYPAPAQQD